MSVNDYQQWLKLGRDLGIEGDELKSFVKERQAELREERAKEREDKKARELLEDERAKRQMEKERERLVKLDGVTKLIGKRIKANVAFMNGNYSYLKELGYIFAEDEIYIHFEEKSKRQAEEERAKRQMEIEEERAKRQEEEERNKRQLEEERAKREMEGERNKRQLEEERVKCQLEEERAKREMEDERNKRQIDFDLKKLEAEIKIKEIEVMVDYDRRQTKAHDYSYLDTLVESTDEYFQDENQNDTYEDRATDKFTGMTNRDRTETEPRRETTF